MNSLASRTRVIRTPPQVSQSEQDSESNSEWLFSSSSGVALIVGC